MSVGNSGLVMEPYPTGVLRIDDPNWAWQDTGRRRRKPAPSLTVNQVLAKALREGGVWEKGTFTVPIATTEERVKLVAHKYMALFGNGLEAKGYEVLRITDPRLDTRPLPVPADRRRYLMWAFVRRRPQVVVFDIPDQHVAEMEKVGLRLKD